jgi:hypothetical protein
MTDSVHKCEFVYGKVCQSEFNDIGLIFCTRCKKQICISQLTDYYQEKLNRIFKNKHARIF